MSTPATKARNEFAQDAFVVFCDRDKDLAVGEVLRPLRAAQLRFVTRDDGILGATKLANLQNAIESSRCTIAVITRNYLEDEICQLIQDAVRMLDADTRDRRLIVLLFEDFGENDAELPLFLRNLTVGRCADLEERSATISKLLIQLCGDRKTLNASVARSAQRGLESLSHFIDTPEVRDMVDAFWDQFEEAGAKIDSLARDKRLHDDFQRAQDLFRIITDRKRELIQELSQTEVKADDVEARWRQLEKAFDGLQVELATAREHALEDTGDSPPPAWLGMLEKAETPLAQGVRDMNVELVKKGTNALTMVIQKEPTRLNKSLVEKAKSLALDKLVKPQRDILAHLETLDFDEEARERIEEFATGTQALERLDEDLQRLLWNHDSLQSVEDQLQPLDESETPELARIQMAWEFVADPLRALRPSKWMLTLKLEETMSAFGKAVADYDQSADKTSAERAIRRWLDKFRPVVARGFHQTDADLKVLCDEINKFGSEVNQRLQQLRCSKP